MYKFKNGLGYFNEDLPVWGDGAYKGKVNRDLMVGIILSGKYNGVLFDDLEILKYTGGYTPRFSIIYNEKRYDVQCGNFLSGQLGVILGRFSGGFKYDIGDIFGDLIVTGRERRKGKGNTDKNINYKWYKYTCTKCGWTDGWIRESDLNNCRGCSCCAGRTVVPHINSIKATAPWMIELGVSEEDAVKYTKSSGKKITVTCPNCGKKKIICVSTIYIEKSIGCSCGDGFSYPEKFMTNVLMQLGVKFETQYSPDYLENKRSDFYLDEHRVVIETDGRLGHEGGITHSYSDKVLDDLVSIDVWKEDIHRDNGLKTIRINCFESDLEYIKNNILESKLNHLFDLSTVDWNKCEEFALKNIVKETCECWNNKQEWETTVEIADKMNISRSSALNYIKKGVKLGWCEYNGREELRKASSKAGKLKGKKVSIFKDGTLLGVFNSCAELERQSLDIFGVRLLNGNISAVCNKKKKHHKGFTFKYIEDNKIAS